jgi:hypothetical protein
MNGYVSNRFRYRCSGRLAGATHASPGCRRELPLRPVEAAALQKVAAVVDALASEPGLRAALERAWRNLSRPGVPDQDRRIAAVEHEAQTARRRLADAATLLVDGTLDREGYEALRDRERATLESAEAELTRLRSITVVPKPPPLDFVLRELGGWSAALHGADVAAQRDVLGMLIEHIQARRVGWGKYEIEIAWTSLGQAIQQVELARAA